MSTVMRTMLRNIAVMAGAGAGALGFAQYPAAPYGYTYYYPGYTYYTYTAPAYYAYPAPAAAPQPTPTPAVVSVKPGTYAPGTLLIRDPSGQVWANPSWVTIPANPQPAAAQYGPYDRNDGGTGGIRRLPRYKYEDGGRTRLKLIEEEGFEERRRTHVGENRGIYVIQRRNQWGEWEDVGETEVGEGLDRESGSRRDWYRSYR